MFLIFAIDEYLTDVASDIQNEVNGQNQFADPVIPISFKMCLKIIDRALKNQKMLSKVISTDNTQLSTAINSVINNQNSNNTQDINDLKDKTSGITHINNKTSIDGINLTTLNSAFISKNQMFSRVLDNLRYMKKTSGLSSGLTGYPTTQLSSLPDLTIFSDYIMISGLKASSTFVSQESYSGDFWATNMTLNGSYCNAIVGDDDVCIYIRGTLLPVPGHSFYHRFLPRLIFNLNQPINQTIKAFTASGGTPTDDTNFLTNPPTINAVTNGSNKSILSTAQYLYAKDTYFQLYVLKVNTQDVVMLAIDQTFFYFLSSSQILGFNKSGCMYFQNNPTQELTNSGAFSTKPFELGREDPNNPGSYWDYGVNSSIYPYNIYKGISMTENSIYKDGNKWTFGDKDFKFWDLYTYQFSHNFRNADNNKAFIVTYNSDNTLKTIQLLNPADNTQTVTYDFS